MAAATPPVQEAPQVQVSHVRVIEAPVFITNARVLSNQVQLTPVNIKQEIQKEIPPAAQPEATSPFKGVAADMTRTLDFQAGKGFVANTHRTPVQRVEDPIETVKGVTKALVAQAQSYAQQAWSWTFQKTIATLPFYKDNPQLQPTFQKMFGVN
jgi:hypothetical protein